MIADANARPSIIIIVRSRTPFITTPSDLILPRCSP
jgi:hypothetical protein